MFSASFCIECVNKAPVTDACVVQISNYIVITFSLFFYLLIDIIDYLDLLVKILVVWLVVTSLVKI